MEANRPNDVPMKFDPTVIERPDKALLKYYVITALLTGPAFPFVLLPLFFKYETLRYTFDRDGISMRWGVLFRKEIHLTYRRIQDIHLSRNFIQRWLGLATVGVQTASGGSGMEMSIEGILEAGPLRDYLYSRMRGAQEDDESPEEDDGRDAGEDPAAESLRLLEEIRDLIRAKSGTAPSGNGAE